jgi:Xaa-Pro aminopeptidase
VTGTATGGADAVTRPALAEEKVPMMRDTARLDRVRHALEQADLDGLLGTLPAHVLMLSGYWPVVGNALVLASRQGRTAVVVPRDENELAEGGWPDEVHTFQPVTPEEMPTLDEAVRGPLAEAARALGLERGRIGFE